LQLRMMGELGDRATLYRSPVGELEFSSLAKPLKEGPYALNAQVARLELKITGAGVPADGVSRLQVTVRAFTASGAPVQEAALLTLEHSGGRLELADSGASSLMAPRLDQDRRTPGTQLRLENGEARFVLVAPVNPQDVRLRISAGETVVEGLLPFDAELREMVAAGLIEGILRINKQHYDSNVTPVRLEDGFEQELRAWSRRFDGDKGTAAARAAMFLKGKIRGDALLTLSYDSEKESRQRLLQEVRPDAYYPVYGDASISGFEARSSGKLFVRIDQKRSFVLYGDFNTGSGFTQSAGSGLVAGSPLSQLGQYNRTLNGLRGHVENTQGVGNVYASRDTLRQAVDEIRANGTSGPFAISSSHALENSDKIEVLVRDKNDLRRILSSQPLQRWVDYSFEPFSGRVLLARPLPSLDEMGNPQSLRISYEVDQGGESFWLFGADGQINLSPALTVGGSLVEDRNPLQQFRLRSVNSGFKVADKTTLVAEAAQTEGRLQNGVMPLAAAASAMGDEVSGSAQRLELFHDGESLKLRAWAQRADLDFGNANAGVTPGTRQMGAQLSAQLKEGLNLSVEAREIQDLASDAKRSGASVTLSQQLQPGLQLSGGLRHSQEQGRVAGLAAGIGDNPAPGSAFAPGSAGGIPGNGSNLLNGSAGLGNLNNIGIGGGLNPGLVPDLNSNTAFVGLRAQVGEAWSLSAQAEGGLNNSQQHRLQLGARYQVAERTGLYARAETQSGLASYYGLDAGPRSHSLSVGVDSSYLRGGNFFSEYRLRDAAQGQEQQLASGLRHAWQLDEGVLVTGGAERLQISADQPQTATALSSSVDYTGSELWKGSARVEWRRLDGASLGLPQPDGRIKPVNGQQDSLLITLAAARKLSRDWTGLLRDYHLGQDNHGLRANGWQNRLQFGAAYRPVDNNRWDLLSMLEYKAETNVNGLDEWRRVALASVHANFHPSRPWWWSARLAAKQVKEQFPLNEGAALSRYSAWLLGGRVVYDISERWDLGLLLSRMQGFGDEASSSRQTAVGVEAGYLLRQNLWLSAGYNFSGFSDRDLSSDYTARGVYLRLRFKFDQQLFKNWGGSSSGGEQP
ncbi:hypothetical protein, partial [Roseateles sp.]|uniref:hypothetical protein n=1 Tax=Roseateles sp. TaxID=1971397 RepID=UPI003BA7E906